MSRSTNPEESIFYTYVYLDPRKSGDFIYQRGVDEVYCFNHELIYVGKTKLKYRINTHIKDALETDKNHIFYSVIRKIYEAGLEPIRFKILQNVTEEEAFAEEISLISIAGRRNLGKGPLCNLTDGGEGCSGWIPTEKWIEAHSGENNRNYGGLSGEHCKNISKAKRLFNETKKGKELSKKLGEEHSIRMSGEGNSMFGKKQISSTRTKISQKAKERYLDENERKKAGGRLALHNSKLTDEEKQAVIEKSNNTKRMTKNLLNPIICFDCEICNDSITHMRFKEIMKIINKYDKFLCKNGCTYKEGIRLRELARKS